MNKTCTCTFSNHGHQGACPKLPADNPDGYCQECWEARLDERDADSAEAGLHGQGSVIRAMARLRTSITQLDASTTVYNRWLLGLTIAIGLLTFVQAIIGGWQLWIAYHPPH